jgi:hypothetical protein
MRGARHAPCPEELGPCLFSPDHLFHHLALLTISALVPDMKSVFPNKSVDIITGT